MTQTSSRLFDEFAKLMTDAAGMAQGVRREVDTVVRSQAERFLSEMDVVKREDFEVVREMAVRAREENERLSARLAALEARIATLEGGRSEPAEIMTASADPSI
ncbi:accessory factor UbiK family protein [Prosthecomicrobium sp. N25]|uniref:accessory factor UbiK family protein n=1 Tax=Prosthecomicrobium sp. N25 TaxID=3129254 RepID=UPI0030770196